MPLPQNATTQSLLKNVSQYLLEDFYAQGGNLEKLEQIINQMPFIKQRLNFAWQLNILTDNCGDFREWTDEEWKEKCDITFWGTSPLDFFILQGNTEILPWAATHKPELLRSPHLALFALESNHLHLLKWLATNKNNALCEKYVWECEENIAHKAAELANTAALEILREYVPQLLLEKAKLSVPYPHKTLYDGNIAHYAGLSGDPAVLDWVFARYPALFDEATVFNPAHYAALSGHPEALEWFLKNKPELLKQETAYFENIAHFAAQSGNPSALDWVINFDVDLLLRISSDDETILDYAIQADKKNVVYYLLQAYPEFTKKLFAINPAADSISASIYKGGTRRCEALNKVLLATTEAIMQHPARDKDISVLKTFKEEWDNFILARDDIHEMLIENKDNFPDFLQETIKQLMAQSSLRM